MSMPGVSWRRCADGRARAALLVVMALGACAGAGACEKPRPVQIGQVMQMGQFVLRADSVQVYDRGRRGVPPEPEVKVVFTVGGGNRFERQDFAEAVARNGRVYLTTSAGWRDRCWFAGVGEDKRTAEVYGRPPAGSSGYALEIGNPYGEPRRFILDLGK